MTPPPAGRPRAQTASEAVGYTCQPSSLTPQESTWTGVAAFADVATDELGGWVWVYGNAWVST